MKIGPTSGVTLGTSGGAIRRFYQKTCRHELHTPRTWPVTTCTCLSRFRVISVNTNDRNFVDYKELNIADM